MKKILITISCALALAQITAHADEYDYDFRNSSNSPRIYSSEGEYLGNLNNNPYDPNSVANPYGAGNPYRSNGVNNPYSRNYMPELMPRRNRR